MKSTAGMTLLEVLIAIVVLAVGVLAAAAMQTNALSATNDARAIQGVTKLAEEKIEFHRQLDYNDPLTERNPECEAPGGYTCTIEVRACQLSGSTLSCTGFGTGADQITVTATGPREKTITLRTVRSR